VTRKVNFSRSTIPRVVRPFVTGPWRTVESIVGVVTQAT
jgi:hypothetical protein